MKRSLLRIALTVAVIAAGGYAFRDPLLSLLMFRAGEPAGVQAGRTADEIPEQAVTVAAEGLEIPWEIAFLPDGSLLVTERPGRLVHLTGRQRWSHPITGVHHAGEGGLMGLALHPDFERTRWIYLSLTADAPGRAGGAENRVERYRFDGASLSGRTVILDGIPAARFHDGGRLAFGPDGHLYITTGDATEPARSQDTASLAGKILRLTDDGRVPPDNPFGNAVYSYGHRNPQGLAWDERGRLWATEHGRSGIQSGLDELNLVESGTNYGWPVIEGDETAAGMVAPVLHSGPDYTWAPAGAAYLSGSIFFGGLRGQALYEARIEGYDSRGSANGGSGSGAATGPPTPADAPAEGYGRWAGRGAEGADGWARRPEAVDLRIHFHRDFGRIRVARVGPDGMLYLATSNRDGRGRPRQGDDRILRVNPRVFR